MRLPDGLRRLAYRLAGREPSIEDERLMALFRNRVELKKELNELDDERHRLLDRLKLQEGSTMRVEEQLEELEQYLGRPDEAYKCLAYFQLKAVWRAASKRLEDFGSELARQQKDRERKQQLVDFDRRRRDRVAVIERDLVEAKVLAEELHAEQKLAGQRLAQLRGWWNYFRRRRLTDAIETRAQRLEESQTHVTDLSDRVHAIQQEAPPLYEGLSLEGRRTINLAVIAYAEMLYDRLSKAGLAELARESTLTRVYDAAYGSQAECVELMRRCTLAVDDLERMAEDLGDIKTRADRMRRSAIYRGDDEVVPDPTSVMPPLDGARRPPPNVLFDEYWDLHRALVR